MSEHQSQSNAEIIQEFYPIMIFGGLFVLMFSLPLVLMGGMAINGIGILLMFAGAMFLLFTLPRLVVPYLVAVMAIMISMAPELSFGPKAFALTVFLLGSVLVWAYLFNYYTVLRRRVLDLEESIEGESERTTPALVEAVVEEEEDEVPQAQFKPVAFDVNLAASGVSIIFGTESGNAEGLAELAKTDLEGDGHSVQVLDAKGVDVRHLKAFANLLILTSTWGEGDPPSNALELTAGVKSNIDLDLSGMQFSVLALGDTNYDLFCQCGKDFDENLARFGGHRFFNRVDCDVDFDAPYQEWIKGVKDALKSGGLKTVSVYDEAAERAKFEAEHAPAEEESSKETVAAS